MLLPGVILMIRASSWPVCENDREFLELFVFEKEVVDWSEDRKRVCGVVILTGGLRFHPAKAVGSLTGRGRRTLGAVALYKGKQVV